MSGLDIALSVELRDAVAFVDKVRASSERERIAVGSDHWDRLEAAARALVQSLWPDTSIKLPPELEVVRPEAEAILAMLRDSPGGVGQTGFDRWAMLTYQPRAIGHGLHGMIWGDPVIPSRLYMQVLTFLIHSKLVKFEISAGAAIYWLPEEKKAP